MFTVTLTDQQLESLAQLLDHAAGNVDPEVREAASQLTATVDSADQARSMARVTGSVGSTHTVEGPGGIVRSWAKWTRD